MKKLLIKDWILYEEVANDGGQPSNDLKEVKVGNADVDHNYHVPFISKTEKGYKVCIGKNKMHPQNDEHNISLLQLRVDNMTYTKVLTLDDEPVLEVICKSGEIIEAREFCNLHGLFENKL